MNPTDVIEAYVTDVMRRLPATERNDIGLELRDLLGEMLQERAQTEGKPADDAMILSILREFGTPAEVAMRYRPPGLVIIQAHETKSFALYALVGVALQWGLTLPQVFAGGQSFPAWWLSWGLGALWWPGFMVMAALAAAWLRSVGIIKPKWKPQLVDSERINRPTSALALVWFALGVVFMVALPWFSRLLPGPFPQIFAFDPAFLNGRAWPVLLLWGASFASMYAVYRQGRWTPLTRKLELAGNLAFIALMGWWIAAGRIFQADATDAGAKGSLAFVILLITADLLYKLYRQQTRIRPPHVLS